MAAKKELSASKKMLAAEQVDKDRPTHPMLVLVAGFVSAVLLFFCCVCGGALWWFQPEIHEDPERARLLTAEIVDIRIPESYLPKGTIEWNVAFTLSVRGVYYERFVGDGLLTLTEVNSRFRADEDVRRHIRQTLMEKGGGGTPLIVDDAETKRLEYVIRGEAVPFTFEIGRDPPSGRTFHIIEGVFEGKNGEVLLAMRVNEDNWELSSIENMIHSIGNLQAMEEGIPLDAVQETPSSE